MGRPPSDEPCFAWQRGCCERGAACHFAHDGFPRAAAEPPRNRAPVPPPDGVRLPASLRCAHIGLADGFADELAAIVRSALGVSDLATLHTTEAGARAVAGEAGRNNELERRWRRAVQAPPGPRSRPASGAFRSRLDRCVRRFVAEVAAPALECAERGYSGLVYQAEPSLRIHLPGAKPGIKLHCDADYYHQPHEVNFWVPLVHGVRGSSSLYLESAPGAADYEAADVPYGSYLRFWANQCRHHTVVNSSGGTRVSLDVRVVPAELYDPAWASPRGTVCFRLGEYYRSVPVPRSGCRSMPPVGAAADRLRASIAFADDQGHCGEPLRLRLEIHLLGGLAGSGARCDRMNV